MTSRSAKMTMDTTVNAAPRRFPKRVPMENAAEGETKPTSKRPRRGGRRNANKKPTPTTPIPVTSHTVDEPKAALTMPPAPTTVEQEAGKEAHLSNVAFTELGLSAASLRAVSNDMGFQWLTRVQHETFAPIASGHDVLAKAKTGHGKTMAFLLPVVERFVQANASEEHRNQSETIPMLAISPTRELAMQIAAEAERLTKYHGFHIACFVGGTPIKRDARVLEARQPIDLLIATPGRLLDHLGQDTGRIQHKLQSLQVLVLDEADRLLDMGFRAELLKLLGYLPKNRQTLLFSATLPKSTQELRKLALRDDHVLVDTIPANDQQTNVQTDQHVIVCKMEDEILAIERVLQDHMAAHPRDYKIIAFFPTARAAQFMAQLFTAGGFRNVLEMHSRKSQNVRVKTAEAFRTGKRVMMFSSDVSARGMDYPDVSLVLQVGLTDRDQYIHRLGRTARAGSAGSGVLVLVDFENPLLRELGDLPLMDLAWRAPEEPNNKNPLLRAISSLGRDEALEKSAQQSYQAWLGFYNSNLKRLGLSREELVQLAADYSRCIGLQEVPKLEKRTLKKMNLFGVTGLVAAPPQARVPRNGNGNSNNNATGGQGRANPNASMGPSRGARPGRGFGGGGFRRD